MVFPASSTRRFTTTTMVQTIRKSLRTIGIFSCITLRTSTCFWIKLYNTGDTHNNVIVAASTGTSQILCMFNSLSPH